MNFTIISAQQLTDFLSPRPRPVLGRSIRIRSFPTVKATFRANYDYILDVSSSDQVRLALSRGGGLCRVWRRNAFENYEDFPDEEQYRQDSTWCFAYDAALMTSLWRIVVTSKRQCHRVLVFTTHTLWNMSKKINPINDLTGLWELVEQINGGEFRKKLFDSFDATYKSVSNTMAKSGI